MADDSCSLLNSPAVDCAGLPASPLVVGGAAGVAASEGGMASLGAATELELELEESSAGAGGASAFLQPTNATTRHAQTRMERVMDIPDIAIS